jgi:hypothetical protein
MAIEMTPEPSEGTKYDSYLWPRSKTPDKDMLYAFLREIDWRYDTRTVTWHTPEGQPHTFGRLEYSPDFTWAVIVPPTRIIDDVPMRSEPILKLVRNGEFWEVET